MTRRRDHDIAAVIARDGGADDIAVCLLLALARALRCAPPGTIDDLLALLAEEDRDDRRR